jgi:geranylgeranyl reductase family protein
LKTFDAVIVGAGPAGSAAAIALARRGYEVALIDKQCFPREKLCGDFVNPINRAIFRALDVEDRILAEPHGRVTGFRITTFSGREAEAGFSWLERESEAGLGLRRALLDHALLQRAEALAVTVRQGVRIEELTRAADGWRMTTGREDPWHARSLIGADGRHSWVARQLGLYGRAMTTARAVGFQCRLRLRGRIGDKIEIHMFPGGYAGVVALGDGTVTLGMAIDKRELGGERGADFLFHRVLAQNPHLKEIIDRSDTVTEFRSVYPVYFPARRAVADGALLVGDAARVSEPVTGEGIYCAMRSGMLAAEHIDLAFQRGDLAAESLAGYERACRRAFRSRWALNALLRFAVYRPALVEPIIRLSATQHRLLHSLVNAVCMP